MKKILILLLLASSVCYAQKTKIKYNQIHEDAFRSVDAGVLSDPELVFDTPYKQYTKTVDSDLVLTLDAVGNLANSRIEIIATGDGVHTLTFDEDDFKMRGDAYDFNQINVIKLEYNGVGVIGEVINQKPIDVLTTDLTSAIVTNEVPTQLNLEFNEAVNITEDGWSVTASAGLVDIGSVSGSGTAVIIFNLSRAILHSETVTVSYTGEIEGTTTDLAGFDLDVITDFPVTVPNPPPPVSETWDIDVCPSGCDFTTGTAAEAAAVDGDDIAFGTGTYRETITTSKSNLKFFVKAGQTANITGLEIIDNTGWTVHSGNIYKKTITLPVTGFNTQSTAFSGNVVPNTTILANQIFRNGTMMFEARYPNVDSYDDIMSWQDGFKQYNDAAGFKHTQLNDVALPTTPPALVGATIASNGWYIAYTRTITGHDNSGPGSTERVTYSAIREAAPSNGSNMRKAYYITGKLGLLDAEQEWHYESGTLYFWQPGGGTPSGTIEYKARNWGFDIRGDANIQIIGFTFTGVDPVISDASSTNTLIQGTTATYNNHHVRHDIGLWNGLEVGMAKQLGTKLLGANSVFKDNVWSKAATVQLWIGPNVIVENNKLSDAGYAGNQGGAISLWEQDGGQKILRNDIYNHGKGCFFFGYVANGNHTNVEIAYNHMYDFGTILGDGGASYAGNQINTTGLNYHHNWIHGNRSREDLGGENGIYFDQATGSGTIHHNVLWDVLNADIYHETVNEYRTTGTLFNIYNNTFASTNVNTGGQSASYKSGVTNPLDIQRNNIYVRRININWQAGNIGNNQNYILEGTNPVFIDPDGTSGLDYRIQTTSPAKDAGQVIPGTTDGFIGSAPDIGAYEFGGEDWVAGYTVPLTDGTVDDDEWDYSVNWTEDNTALAVMNNSDVHYTATTGSTATFQFTNSKADFYYEACNQHGIAKFEVLDAGLSVIATADVDTYSAVDCNSGTRETHSFTGLAAGIKTARVTFLTADLGQTPPRATIAIDGGKFFD